MANENPETAAERAALAAVLKQVVVTRFDGKAKAAYSFARLNPETWANLVKAKSAKSYSVIAAVNAFWPDAGGDWRNIPGLDLDADLDDMDPGELRAEIQRLRQVVARLSGPKLELIEDEEVLKAPDPERGR